MHNIRPEGQMWPTEAFYLARKAHNFAYFVCLFIKTSFEEEKMLFLALEHDKKKFLVRHEI